MSGQRCGGVRVYSLNNIGVTTTGVGTEISLKMAQAPGSAGPVRIGNACVLYAVGSAPAPPPGPDAQSAPVVAGIVVGIALLIAAPLLMRWQIRRRARSTAQREAASVTAEPGKAAI